MLQIYLHRFNSITYPLYFCWGVDLVFSYSSLFLEKHSDRYLLFMFNKLCEQFFFFFSSFVYFSIHVSTEDQNVVFGNVSVKGRYIIIDSGDDRFITCSSGTVANDNVIVYLPLNIARVILGWILSMHFVILKQEDWEILLHPQWQNLLNFSMLMPAQMSICYRYHCILVLVYYLYSCTHMISTSCPAADS